MRNYIFNKKLNEAETVRRVAECIGNIIYTGPFAGLKIPPNILSKLKLAEILGLYELAFHPFFGKLLNKNIQNIMEIGGHKGYYAAGLSYIFNPSNLYVFESDESLFPLIDSWFELNNLKQYQKFGEANFQVFSTWNKPIDLLIIDCEGAEKDLLNPSKFTWQKSAYILVEVHHFYQNNLLQTLRDAVIETHNIHLFYDDLTENERINVILKGLGINGSFRGHPNHRWILQNNKKIITSGIFLYLEPKTVIK